MPQRALPASAGALQARVAAVAPRRRATDAPRRRRGPRRFGRRHSADGHCARHEGRGQPRPIRACVRRFDARCESRGGPERPRCHRSRSADVERGAHVATVVKNRRRSSERWPQTVQQSALSRSRTPRRERGGAEALALEHAPLRGREARRPGVVPELSSELDIETARIFIVVGQSRMRVSFRVIRDNSQEPQLATSYARRAPMLAPSLDGAPRRRRVPAQSVSTASRSRRAHRTDPPLRPRVAHTRTHGTRTHAAGGSRGRGIARAPVRRSSAARRGIEHDGARSRVGGHALRGRGRAPFRDLRALQRRAHALADGLCAPSSTSPSFASSRAPRATPRRTRS